MSEQDADRAIERLREIAARLRDPQIGEEETETLAREAADLVGRVSNEVERLLRELPPEDR
jgi:hypothetical protein